MKVEFSNLVYEENDDIAYLYLNTPPANIMTPEFFDEIILIIDEYIGKSKTSGVIITGKGRHFSSGTDVQKLVEHIYTEIQHVNEEVINYPDWYIKCRKAFKKLYELDLPVISVVKGFCIGSGFELALASHIIICEKSAKLGAVESNFDLLPGLRGTIRLSQMLGVKKAQELVLLGEMLNANEAYEIGIVDYIAAKNMAELCAKKFIHYIKENCNDYSKEKAKELFNKSNTLD